MAMTAEQIKERIQKLEDKIAKKETLIQKNNKVLAKYAGAKTAEELRAVPMDARDDEWENAYEIDFKVRRAKESNTNAEKEITKAHETLKKYHEQLAKAQETEAIRLPEAMQKLIDEIVSHNDAYDYGLQEKMRNDRRNMTYKEFSKKYDWHKREFMLFSKEKVHKDNTDCATTALINAYRRVGEIVGDVKDWKGITLHYDNDVLPILNGLIIGDKGRARIESICAGGYNIQKLHIRVLVKAV